MPVRRRHREFILCVLAGALVGGCAAEGIERDSGGDSPAGLRLDTAWLDAIEADREPVIAGWRYHPGDDMAWRDPEFDDADWAVAFSTEMRGGTEPPGGFPGVGWFRLTVEVAPEVAGVLLAYDMTFTGAAAVYVDGEPELDFGHPELDLDNDRIQVKTGVVPRPLVLAEPGRHVIAVRFFNSVFGRYTGYGGQDGFQFVLGRYGPFVDYTLRMHRAVTAVNMFGLGAMTLMGIMHLMFFVLQPRDRTNLWFAIAVLAVAGIAGISQMGIGTPSGTRTLIHMHVFQRLGVFIALGFALFYFETTRPPWRWPMWVILAGGAFVFFYPGLVSDYLTYGLDSAGLIAGAVFTSRAVLMRRRGARILAFGLLICLLGVGYQILADLQIIERITPEPLRYREYIVGMLGLLLSMSAYVAFRMRFINRQLQLRLGEVRRLGDERMRALSQLTAGIAHEINSPVGAIASGADTVKRAAVRLREALSAEGATPGVEDRRISRALRALDEVAGSIDAGAVRIDQTVTRMRRFTHLDKAETQRVDLDEEIDGAMAMLTSELDDGVLVERQRGDLPPVLCAPASLNQVFLNLLRNAVEALPASGGTVTITTSRKNDRVRILIADDGRGIATKDLRHVFDPGYTTKSGGVGTGLGLAISRRIVEEHGGRLTLRSRKGKGASVMVSLPITSSI